MRNMKSNVFRLIIITTVICCCFCFASAETRYTENDLNFMDTAMDVSKGIPEDADGDLGRIHRNGVLRVATDSECAPLSFLDPSAEGNERYAGLDMELARLIAQRMGVELVIISMPSDQMLLSLIEDQCDLTICGVTYTPGRAQYYTLSRSYYKPDEEPDIGILVRKDQPVTSLKDLDNRIIAAQSNSIQEAFAACEIKEYREFRRTTSAKAVFEMVENGTADAGIVSIRIANTYFLNDPEGSLCLAEGLAFLPEEQYRGYRVAAKKGETQLIAFINGVIDEAEEAGLPEIWLTEATERAEALGLLEK